MAALVTIAGYELPEPSSYSANTATLVDSARNVEGYVIGAVVRPDVAKVELSWRYLTVEQWARILQLFNRSFYNNVTFFNQSTGTYDTRQMYVGDRSAGMWRRHPLTEEVMGWVDCKMSLIEV
jgi:hypothetical protein